MEHTFTVPASPSGVILETVTIRNTPTLSCPRPISNAVSPSRPRGETWTPDAAEITFCPCPTAARPTGRCRNGPCARWPNTASPTAAGASRTSHAIWGAEGWGGRRVRAASFWPNTTPIRWNGRYWSPKTRHRDVIPLRRRGAWKYGHPEHSTRLDAGKAYTFGETRLQIVPGDWKQAYYAYRDYVTTRAAGRPGLQPPVQWNELYDNDITSECAQWAVSTFGPSKPGFCLSITPPTRSCCRRTTASSYQRRGGQGPGAGLRSALSGSRLGGGPSRQIWDAERLGPMVDFVRMLREQYSLNGVCFWCSLAGVPPPSVIPRPGPGSPRD